MDLKLKDKVALVTGGSTGIGFAIATELVKEGASVIIASRNQENIEIAVGKLRSLGGKASGVVMDLEKEKSIRDAVQGLSQKIDILINNVGGPQAGKALEIPLEAWDKGYTSLIRSVILLTQLVIPQMKERSWGRILTVTSTSAREIIPALPVSGVFRAGLTSWVKTLSKEVGRSGILVNNILPGPTKTERLAHLAKESPDFYESMAQRSALGRVAEPEELGRVGAFLVSGANTYITGTEILVDGGATNAL